MRILGIIAVLIILASFVGAANTGSYHTFYDVSLGVAFRCPAAGEVEHLGQGKVRIDLPVEPGTTLIEKYLVIESAAEEDSPTDGIVVGGIRLWFDIGSEGAAGSIYAYLRCHASLANGRRFTLTFVLHSVNPGVFTFPPPLFNRVQEVLPFWAIILSLHRI